METLATVLSPPIMSALWAVVVAIGIAASIRTRQPAPALIAVGAAPWLIFYLWTWFGVWPSMAYAVAFSRLAGAVLALNLTAGAYRMCKLVRRP